MPSAELTVHSRPRSSMTRPVGPCADGDLLGLSLTDGRRGRRRLRCSDESGSRRAAGHRRRAGPRPRRWRSAGVRFGAIDPAASLGSCLLAPYGLTGRRRHDFSDSETVPPREIPSRRAGRYVRRHASRAPAHRPRGGRRGDRPGRCRPCGAARRGPARTYVKLAVRFSAGGASGAGARAVGRGAGRALRRRAVRRGPPPHPRHPAQRGGVRPGHVARAGLRPADLGRRVAAGRVRASGLRSDLSALLPVRPTGDAAPG